jgi:hypothetical protein
MPTKLTEDERIEILRKRAKRERREKTRQTKRHKIILTINGKCYPKLPYNEYLKTKWWKCRRRQALRNANHKCQRCDEKHDLEVHHLRYTRLWCEKKEDLIVLCRWHHLNEHPEHCEGDNLPEELRVPISF